MLDTKEKEACKRGIFSGKKPKKIRSKEKVIYILGKIRKKRGKTLREEPRSSKGGGKGDEIVRAGPLTPSAWQVGRERPSFQHSERLRGTNYYLGRKSLRKKSRRTAWKAKEGRRPGDCTNRGGKLPID